MATGQQYLSPPQYTTTAQQVQNVPQNTNPKSDKVRPIPAVRFFSIATLVIAFLWCILGIVAIVIEAKDSYVGDPIWSGLLFLFPTGILGLATYWKRNSSCLNVMYLILSVFTCIVCGHLVIYGSVNAAHDRFSTYYTGVVKCDPWPGYHWVNYHDDDYFEECEYGPSGRMAVNIVIALLAFVQLVLTIVSLGFTCYGTCMCCYSCCRPAPPPAVIQYTAQNGQCQLVSVGGYNNASGYQPVSLMMVQQAPAGQIVSPSMNVVQAPQTQPVFIPAGSPPVTYVQQPINATPGNFVNPTAPTAANADGTPLTTPDEKQTTSDTGQVTLSYGQTASDDLQEKKNLIQIV
ncbi:uncharacterized protein [Amphiura filiformis]|uniref:uncharacterized protein n=1 Tax=Amphiura filiformis TaxID=82378 RepID=UPI003B21EAAE